MIIFAAAMAKYILYILLGLFLIAKFASVPNEQKEYKSSDAIGLQYTDNRDCLSKAETGHFKKELSNREYGCYKAERANTVPPFSMRSSSCSKNLRTDYFFIPVNLIKSLKLFLSEEKTSSLTSCIHPLLFSYRYYVYTLRRILI